MMKKLLLLLLLFGSVNILSAQSYRPDYEKAKSNLDKENWELANKFYTIAINKGLDETINIGKEKIPFLLIRCLIGRGTTYMELAKFNEAAVDFTIVISFYNQNKLIATQEELSILKNYLPEAYFDRGTALGLAGLKKEACEDLKMSLKIDPEQDGRERTLKTMEIFECNSIQDNNIENSTDKKITKFRILEAEISKKLPTGTFSEATVIKNPPSLMMLENGQRLTIYASEKQVFDIFKILPTEEYKSDKVTFQPFEAVDHNGNEMTHRFVNIAGDNWVYLTYPDFMVMYRYEQM